MADSPRVSVFVLFFTLPPNNNSERSGLSTILHPIIAIFKAIVISVLGQLIVRFLIS